MPIAPSTVDMTTDIVRILSTSIPEARANSGLEPTAVIAVPVLVRKKAQTRKETKAKKRNIPTGM